MEIQRETGMVNITNKMTQIRREKKGPILQNYYMNCKEDEEILAVYGKDSIVFWCNDNGLHRAYFCSTAPDELIMLLKQVPKGAVIDYLTHSKGENETLFAAAGYTLVSEMMRMSSEGKRTAEERQAIERKYEMLGRTCHMHGSARAATDKDCVEIYDKMYEVFDVRDSHLCTRETLLEYIRNKWVIVSYENGKLVGFQIFTIQQGLFYGYLIWNNAGVKGYYNLSRMAYKLYLEQVEDIPKNKRTSYVWVNMNNKKGVGIQNFWGRRFNGLYDFVYEKQ